MLNGGMLHAVACSLAVFRFSVDVGFLVKEQVSFGLRLNYCLSHSVHKPHGTQTPEISRGLGYPCRHSAASLLNLCQRI